MSEQSRPCTLSSKYCDYSLSRHLRNKYLKQTMSLIPKQTQLVNIEIILTYPRTSFWQLNRHELLLASRVLQVFLLLKSGNFTRQKFMTERDDRSYSLTGHALYMETLRRVSGSSSCAEFQSILLAGPLASRYVVSSYIFCSCFISKLMALSLHRLFTRDSPHFRFTVLWVNFLPTGA